MGDTNSIYFANLPPLRILCFGDSLTAGYSKYGLIHAPYSKSLELELEIRLWGRKVDVTTNGQSGDLVTVGSFKKRMNAIYSTSTYKEPLYNYAIFLGGTNDLGWGKPASEIWNSIKAVTAIPLLHGSCVLLMTVPECGVKSEILDRKRDELNKSIREDRREGVYTYDLHAAIPYHSMPESERQEIWDDGLHFTPKGYERMGELIAARLIEIIEAAEAAEVGDEVAKGDE